MRLELGFSILNTSFPLVERLIRFNKNYSSLKGLRELANLGSEDFTMEDGLLLCYGRLVVPDVDNVRTNLVREAHE